MFETLGLGVDFLFRNSGQRDIDSAISGMRDLYGEADNIQKQMGLSSAAVGAFGAALTAGVTVPVTALMKKLSDAGIVRASFVQDTTIGFKSLMGSAKEAGQYMSDLLAFAQKTPFSFMGLTSAAQEMNTYGIESKKVFEILQSIGDYAGGSGLGEPALQDIASILAVINSEGKASAIRIQQLASRGVNAVAIIGNLNKATSQAAALEMAKGMSAVDFIDQLTQGLNEGTNGVLGITSAYKGMMNELQYTWTGANDKFKGALQRTGLELMGQYMDEEGMMQYRNLDKMTAALNHITTAVKQLGPLLEPLVSLIASGAEKGAALVEKLAVAFGNLPPKTKTALSYLVGALALIGPGLVTLTILIPKLKAFLGISELGKFSTEMLKAAKVAGGFAKQILGLGLSLGALYFLWKYDVLGIRSSMEQFTTSVKTAFAASQDIIKKGSISIKTELGNMDVSNKFIDRLTAFFIRVQLLWDGVVMLFRNNYTLSDEMYKNLEAAGLLGVVTKIAMVLYRLGLAWDGFKVGFEKTMKGIKSIFDALFKPIFDAMGDGLVFFMDKITDFLIKIGVMDENSALLDKNIDKWTKFGEALGGVAAVLLTLIALKKSVGLIAAPINFVKKIRNPIAPAGESGGAGGGSGGIGAGAGAGASAGSKIPKSSTVLRAMGDLALIIGGFTLMVAAYAALSQIPGFNQFMTAGLNTLGILFKGMAKLALDLGAIVLLVAVTGKVAPQSVTKTMGNIAIILGGFTLIISAYGLLAQIPGFNDFLSSGRGTLTALFDAMGAFFSTGFLLMVGITAVLGIIPVSTVLSGMASMAIMMGGFTLIISAYGGLAQIPGFNDFLTSGGETMRTLFEVMGVFASPSFFMMAAVVALMGVLSPVTFVSGMAGLAVVLAGFTVLISAYGGLAQIPGFNDFLTSGGEVMATLFNQIGVAFGSLVGGVLEGVTNSLPGIADNLAEFANRISPFFTTLSNAPLDGMGDFLTSFGQFMLLMSADNFLSMIAGSTDLPQLGTDLGQFGTNAQGFFAAVSAYPDDGIRKAPLVFEAISNLGGYATKSGGLAQMFTGSTNLKDLGEGLASFGSNGYTFFAWVATYPDEGIRKASSVFEAISNLGGYATKSGGLAQMFTGSTNLKDLGEGLASFGSNGYTFFAWVATYPDDGIRKSRLVFEAISDLGGYATKSGGLAQLFTGSTDLPKLGEDLASFGENVKPFFDYADSVPVTGISKGKQIFESLGVISGYEFKSGGMAQWFTGSTDIASVGTQMTTFGEAIKGFFDIAAAIDNSTIEKGKNIFASLQAISGYEFKSGGLAQVFTGEVDLSVIGNQLATFGTSIAPFFATAETITYDGINRARSIFSALEGLSEFMGNSMLLDGPALASLGQGLSDFATNATTFFATDYNTESVVAITAPLKNFFAVFTGSDLAYLSTASTNMNDLGDSVVKLSTDLKSMSDNIVVGFGDNVKLINQYCNDLSNANIVIDTEKLTAVGSSIPTIIGEGITSAEAKVSTAINGMFTNTLEYFPVGKNAQTGVMSKLDVYGKSIPTIIGENVEQNKNLLRDGINGAFSSCDSLMPGNSEGTFSYSNMVGYGKKVMTTIASGINQNSSVIKSAVKDAFDKASAVLPHSDADEGPFSDLSGSGRAILETIAQGIAQNSGSVKTAIQSAFNQASSILPHSDAPEGPFSSLSASGRSIPDTIAKGIYDNADAVHKAMTGLDGTFTSNVDSAANIAVNSSGLGEVMDNITGVFIGILDISGRIRDNFLRADNIPDASSTPVVKPTTEFVGIDIVSILESFARINNAIPAYSAPAYAERMNAVYNNRVDTSNVQNNNNNGMKVVFQEGAFKIEIVASKPQDMVGAMPQLRQELESTVVDIVRKLKDERYEE